MRIARKDLISKFEEEKDNSSNLNAFSKEEFMEILKHSSNQNDPKLKIITNEFEKKEFIDLVELQARILETFS